MRSTTMAHSGVAGISQLSVVSNWRTQAKSSLVMSKFPVRTKTRLADARSPLPRNWVAAEATGSFIRSMAARVTVKDSERVISPIRVFPSSNVISTTGKGQKVAPPNQMTNPNNPTIIVRQIMSAPPVNQTMGSPSASKERPGREMRARRRLR